MENLSLHDIFSAILGDFRESVFGITVISKNAIMEGLKIFKLTCVKFPKVDLLIYNKIETI
jgi:hypothetical protein